MACRKRTLFIIGNGVSLLVSLYLLQVYLSGQLDLVRKHGLLFERREAPLDLKTVGPTLVMGSLNSLAFNIATYLSSRNRSVTTVDNYNNATQHPSFHLTEKRQLYIEKLTQAKHLYPNFLRTSGFSAEINDIIDQEQINTVIYIPPKDDFVHKENGIELLGEFLKSFFSFLNSENLRHNIKIVLLLPLTNLPTHQATLELFSLILQSYQSNYHLNVQVGHVEEGFNSETCGNFDDLINFLFNHAAVKNAASNTFKLYCEKKKEAMTIITEVKKQNILFSTYFTNNKQFVRPYRENSFQFVKGFVVTAKKYNARIVIYYDVIDPVYKERLLEFYNNIELIQYTGNYHHRTINDARFYIMYEYLQAHPEVDRVILQDLRDGIYLTDPFKVMELVGDYLFVGMDKSYHRSCIAYRPCEGKLRAKYRVTNRGYPMLNAGTLGGTRHMILAYLKKIIQLFTEIFPANRNCNMDAFDFTGHQFFSEVIYSGYPFQGFMQIGLASPPGIAIRHKRTKYDM